MIFLLISTLTFLLIFFGLVEFKQHQRYLMAIPIRIHVNGTRGKSSVTRLIGAGLRAGGYKTITKVTGTFPRMVLNNGDEVAIHRKEKANILEQLKIVKFCAKEKAEVLLIECMALQPNYQRITEHQMIKATHGVITNIRLDHLDVMGPQLKDVAEALSLTIPKKSKLFTSENRMLDFLEKKAKKLETELISTTDATITTEDMHGFTYIEHPENVSLALAVCSSLNVDKELALNAMKRTYPDEGVLKKHIIIKNGCTINFYNALAANDPESSVMLWNSIMNIEKPTSQKVIILNSRKDRKDRSMQLIEAIANLDFDILFLTGENENLVRSMALKQSISTDKIICIGQNEVKEQFLQMQPLLNSHSVLVAFGNMGAGGAELAKYFEQFTQLNKS